MAKTFTFDLLGVSPRKLKNNLEKLSGIDRSFYNAKITHEALKNPIKRNQALAFVKAAKRQKNNPNVRKYLYALYKYNEADKLEKERKKLTGSIDFTVGIDYQSFLSSIKKPPDILIGADPPGLEGLAQLRRMMAGKSYRTFWLKKNHTVPKYNKYGMPQILKPRASYGQNKLTKYLKDYYAKLRRETDKKKLADIEKRIVHALPKYFGVPVKLAEALFQKRVAYAKVQAKERKEKALKVVKAVAKVAVAIAKVIPGVGEAVKSAEEAVKQIPGVKEGLEVASKVKDAVKEAKAIGDVAKLEQIKDLGLNPEIRKALKMDSAVGKIIENSVNNVKILEAANVKNIAEKLAPEKIQVAMKLVNAAKEMDPAAIMQINSIKKLADSGLLAAEKALHSLNVAVRVQQAAKDQAMSQYRMWQYF